MTDENKLRNINIVSKQALPSPELIKRELPLHPEIENFVFESRQAIKNILEGRDKRLLIVVGPCSIHDSKAALEYAKNLKGLAEELKESFLIVMRVYFEKPRTTVGWKGFINDPYLDDSFQIGKGLRLARSLLLQILETGLATGTEAVDPITPQYLDELVSWTAIGARTTESQTHREMSSGLSTPVGFKNGTDGSIDVAINAMKSAAQSHHFLGINQQGQCTIFQTRGNRDGHIVLRGGRHPNYQADQIQVVEKELEKNGLRRNIMVDCSHGNSLKQHEQQVAVFEECISQIEQGNRSIIGFMIESNLRAGNQSISKDLSKLKYGVSVTDACIDWKTTETVLRSGAKRLKNLLLAQAY